MQLFSIFIKVYLIKIYYESTIDIELMMIKI